MASALAAGMSGLSLGVQQRPASYSARCSLCSSFLGAQHMSAGLRLVSRPAASPSVILAAQNSKKRQRVEEKRRLYNKSRKSAVGTRSKKVIKALADFNLRLPESEADLKPVDVFLAEAYQEIDKAISKGILHKNTGARRKSKLALARQKLLVKAGLYDPLPQAA